MKLSSLRALSQLVRFELSLTAGTCVLLGELLALGGLPSLSEAVYGFLGVFFISASALILNDYFDIEIDRINAPTRPLPSGRVTKADVIILFIVFTLLGLGTSALINLQALAVSSSIWLVGYLYNWRFKRSGLAGNLFVCFSVGMTFIFAGVVVNRPFEKTVWFMAVVVALINLGEEIAADSLDVEGDRRAGSRSLAVILGPERAMNISAGIFYLVVAISGVPFVFGWLRWPYALPLVVLDILIVFSTFKLLNPAIPRRIRYIRTIYLGGLGVLILFIVLHVSIL